MPERPGPAYLVNKEEAARFRRLAIVIAAQLPGDAAKAATVLRHVGELVGYYRVAGDGGPELCFGSGRMCQYVGEHEPTKLMANNN